MDLLAMAMVAAFILITVFLHHRVSSQRSPYALLSSPLYPCSSSAPLLSADRFALLCIPAALPHTDSFFIAVSFFNPTGPPLWIANPSHPVSRNASLALSASVLYLSDPRSVPAWSLSFPSSSPRPYALSLGTSGNLLVVDSSYTALWQSFLYPLDILLPKQVMTPGMQLISQSLLQKSHNITYSAVMESAGLALFVNFSNSNSLPYSVFGLDPLSSRLDSVMYGQDSCLRGENTSGHSAQFFHDGRQLVLRDCISNVSGSRSIALGSDGQTVDFIRLDSDGSMRGYTYDYGNAIWRVVYDWFTNSSNGICSMPNVCGRYGICRHSSSNQSHIGCSCPSLPSNSDSHTPLFSRANSSDSHQGCRLAHPLNCTLGQASHYFIELQGVDYFANEALSSQHILNNTKWQCVAACAQNCTCKAAFYRDDIGACFLYEQVLSIIELGNSTELHYRVFDYKQTTASGTQKVAASSKQLSAGGWATRQAQSTQVLAPQSSMYSGTRDSNDVLLNYVGYLKVQNNSVEDGASVAKSGDRRYFIITLASTIAGLILLGVTCSLLCVCCKKRRRFKALGDEEFFTSAFPCQHTMVHFTFAQLQQASGDFKSKLGIGGFGSVYKGTLPNGSSVAIKQLESAIRCEKEFESQILFLNSLNHPNLVSLNGFSIGGSRRFLVSEYMMNGSLDAWIFHKPINKSEEKFGVSPCELDWITRFKIILDVAKGLAFLHQSHLIHLDVKPQNILLDDKFVAKLSDYGISRLMDREEGSTIMHMRGTTGYMAPEWIQHACATEKSDVYSYGMVLMEMLGGRKNVDLSKERESWYFPVLAAKMYEEGRVLELLDEKLTRCKAMGETECEQARRVLQVAFWCIVENPSKRPDMGDVMLMLQGQQEVPEPPLPLHFGGPIVHEMRGDGDNPPFHNNQSGSSSPTCFDISYTLEPRSTLAAYSSWSSVGSQLDDCSLLLPSHDEIK